MTSAVYGKGGGQILAKGRKEGCLDLVLTRGGRVQNPKILTDVVCERPLPSLDHPSSLDHAAVLLVETRAVLYANEVEDQRTWQCEYFSDVGQTKSSLMYVINYLSLTQGFVDG